MEKHWLYNLDEASILNEKLPLKDILTDSLFYPASGTDGKPIKFLSRLTSSFVYVDYSLSKNEAISEMDKGFVGYHLIGRKFVSKEELTPFGWTPTYIPISEDEQNRLHFLQKAMMRKPFAIWAIYQRNDDRDANHGPLRFSLLYICGEGAATFDALYLNHKVSPLIIAIIQSGEGFGDNWTSFRNPNARLHQLVMRNSAGTPKYLMYGGGGHIGDYKESCWYEYNFLMFEDGEYEPEHRRFSSFALFKKL